MMFSFRKPALIALLFVTGALLIGCPSDGLDDQAVADNNRGVALMGQFDYPAAMEVFKSLYEQYPNNADLAVNLAIATLNRQQDGDSDKAMELLGRALEDDPDHLRAMFVRGVLLLFVGEAEEAREDFLKVAAADPDDPDSAFYLGQCLMQHERYQEALGWYEKAVELDPYLRSAYYRAFQAMQRVGDRENGKKMLEIFQKLADNPRSRLVEYKYTKMGRRAEAITLGRGEDGSRWQAEGPAFADQPAQLMKAGVWPDSIRPAGSVTSADINHDGKLDLFFAGVFEAADGLTNAVLISHEDGSFSLEIDHPLARVPDVNAPLWADVDNDGRLDVYLCRTGPNQLWQSSEQGWQDVTEESGVAGDDVRTTDGVVFDADHDGDLDLYLVNHGAPNELFNNNRDGSFKPLGQEFGVAGHNPDTRAVVVADFDGDQDADLLLINQLPPHEVLENHLLWTYRKSVEGWEAVLEAEMVAAVAGDIDADGSVDLLTATAAGALQVWRRDSRVWQPTAIANLESADDGARKMALADVNGDGALEVLTTTTGAVTAFDPLNRRQLLSVDGAVGAWALASLNPGRGPSLVALPRGESPVVFGPGKGRGQFVVMTLSGQEDTSNSMRSNRSGIGSRVAVRTGTEWTVVTTFRSDSGPGQSLQPVEIGIGGREMVDFVAIDWSDGVYQTEIALAAGTEHRITETQRQLSSCPVLFAWDGSTYRFVSDLLGVAGIGYAIAPGEYGEPRPWEVFLLPLGLPQVHDGRLSIKLSEPMEEALYLDSARLTTYDLPPGWSMVIDERMGILGPQPTGKPVYFRTEVLPVRAHNERGEDVLDSVAAADKRAAPVGSLDHRFIGLLKDEHVLTIGFENDLSRLGSELFLVADGWVEYPYSQTNFAAWQAGRVYEAPTLEARGANGQWHVLMEQFGYPAGMPRRMALPLPELPDGTTELRLRTNQEVYWDRLAVIASEHCPQARRTELPMIEALVSRSGFARRTTGAQRLPGYEYARRAPVWDTRIQSGWYTRLGHVEELLVAADGALVITGPGEEVQLDFSAPTDQIPSGWQRLAVLETEGWCKDMDLYTKDGRTLAPIPGADRDLEARNRLHQEYNTRYMNGRE